MPRSTKPLSFTEIKTAKPKETEYSLNDGDGLMITIRPNGSKTWFFRYYHPHTNKRQKIGFGAFPEVSLQNAREKRAAARSLVADGVDPKTHREKKKREAAIGVATTLEVVAEKWFEVKKTKVTPDYADDVWRSLENHVFPALGKTPITYITAFETIEALEPLKVKGTFEQIRRVCQRLNEIMVYATNTGLTHSNPLSGISKAFQSPKRQNMKTIKPEELAEFLQCLQTASLKVVTRCLIEWQLHTMTRPAESAGASWSELDLKNKLWIIPKERMKKGREHIIPLSAYVLDLVEFMRPISGHRAFIFPSYSKPDKHTHASTSNAAILRMGYQGRLVSHGLRSLASTTLNEQGFSPDIIEVALAHVDKNEVRRAYNRADYLEQRRNMMQWWSDHIVNAANGNMSMANSKRNLRAIGN
jgi:integrase